MEVFKDLVTECYNNYVAKVYKIYDVFKDFFGEERVDIQDVIELPDTLSDYIKDKLNNSPTEEGKKAIILNYFNIISHTKNCTIYVHWPAVRITNEYDKSTDIYNLYAKVKVNYIGCLKEGFALNRSTYPLKQFQSNYMHSHISNIPYNNIEEFQRPCTGTGPINKTIHSLAIKYDEDIWALFCCELNNFVSVESIQGRPYHRLEDIGISSSYNKYKRYYYIAEYPYCMKKSFDTVVCRDPHSLEYNYSLWREFIEVIIKSRKLKFSFCNGEYEMGMSLSKCTILLTELFIDWFNQNHNRIPNINVDILLDNETLIKGFYKGGCIYDTSQEGVHRDLSLYNGKKVLSFKGKDVLLEISDIPEPENYSLFLNSLIVNYIVTISLKILNYRYGKPKDNNNSEHTEVII